VPLSEYKRDEEFPLEKKPWRPWPIITVDWNPCRIVTVQIHPLWPLVPKCHLGSHSAVGSLFEVLIHASQFYSLSFFTRVSFMTFHSSLRFCHLDLTRVFFGDVGQLDSSSCCAFFALVVLVSRAHRYALFLASKNLEQVN
jgi:hypothetical protein